MHAKSKIALLFLPFILSLILLSVSIISGTGADFIARNITQRIKLGIALISSLFPFSIFEIFVFLFPIILILLVVYTVKGIGCLRFICALGALSSVFALYITTMIISSVSEGDKYAPTVSTDELFDAANILTDEINLYNEVDIQGKNFSETASFVRRLCREKSHGWLPRAKGMFSSSIASKLGILGMYSFLTAEININTTIPSYMIPFSVAHEYSHYLGTMDEGLANYHAFSALYRSEIPYIRYSASLSALEYIMLDLKHKDAEKYTIIYNSLPDFAKSDLKEGYEFLNKCKSAPSYSVSDRLHGVIAVSGGYSLVSRYVTKYLLSA